MLLTGADRAFGAPIDLAPSRWRAEAALPGVIEEASHASAAVRPAEATIIQRRVRLTR